MPRFEDANALGERLGIAGLDLAHALHNRAAAFIAHARRQLRRNRDVLSLAAARIADAQGQIGLVGLTHDELAVEVSAQLQLRRRNVRRHARAQIVRGGGAAHPMAFGLRTPANANRHKFLGVELLDEPLHAIGIVRGRA